MSADDLFHKTLEEPRTVFGDGYLDLIGTDTRYTHTLNSNEGMCMGRTVIQEKGEKRGREG